MPNTTWWKHYNQEGRKKFWTEKWALEGGGPPPPPPAACAEPSAKACSAPGIFGLFDDAAANLKEWGRLDVEATTDEYLTDCPLTDDELADDSSDDEYDFGFDDDNEPREAELPAWDKWEAYLDSKGFPAGPGEAAVPVVVGDCESGQPDESALTPALPCKPKRTKTQEPHRHKIPFGEWFPFNAAVARPVRQWEINANPKAKASMDAEWNRLREQ